MRKIIVLFTACVFVFACGSNEEKPAEDKTAETPAATQPANYDSGLEMIGALDCTTCHKISEKNIGPAYTDVAQKYEFTDANVVSLAHKVINGGSGVWGSLPMASHPNISMDSARQMVRYILSLRNK